MNKPEFRNSSCPSELHAFKSNHKLCSRVGYWSALRKRHEKKDRKRNAKKTRTAELCIPRDPGCKAAHDSFQVVAWSSGTAVQKRQITPQQTCYQDSPSLWAKWRARSELCNPKLNKRQTNLLRKFDLFLSNSMPVGDAPLIKILHAHFFLLSSGTALLTSEAESSTHHGYSGKTRDR